ncbi:Daunorubicin/doxorubicin resistance ATP-binding protein DrrA [Lacticaseibacillus paracasei]|uniref:ABC transporter ATP-binding protein n=1 Tax=Lacticaseibacillus paracasei TaxID=1597 RepID=UPI000FF27BCE|nr:ABC transporter ATP-binding protein [Lacticaseibacillus paracasei]RNE08511.1 Daunorubicin/doxorubicin resistance ATP-binding protein DrrA [Lacticaseibacillus paracasei]
MNILKVTNLCKTYKTGKKALTDLNFTVEAGEILGFLGPNGAGKSTTINIISTLLKADAGSIVYFNNPDLSNKAIKKRLGTVPQDIALYEDISAYENVKFFAALYGVKRDVMREKVDSALEKVGLLDRKDDKPETFSGGMKRRLNIACAIAHEPDLIIFDEPTVGIDPQSRNHILESIKLLRKNGATVIYVTHYMEEVQQICDRIIIMDGGTVLLNDKLANILKTFGGATYQLTLVGTPSTKDVQILESMTGISQAECLGRNDLLLRMTDTFSLNRSLVFLNKHGLALTDIVKQERSLEDVFLTLTGKRLRD